MILRSECLVTLDFKVIDSGGSTDTVSDEGVCAEISPDIKVEELGELNSNTCNNTVPDPHPATNMVPHDDIAKLKTGLWYY